jgi:hypothetical protein
METLGHGLDLYPWGDSYSAQSEIVDDTEPDESADEATNHEDYEDAVDAHIRIIEQSIQVAVGNQMVQVPEYEELASLRPVGIDTSRHLGSGLGEIFE